MSPGSVRDEPRVPSPVATRDQNNVSPLEHGAGAQQGQQAPVQNGNVSSFEEGDDNVAEKGGAAAAGLGKRQKVKRHCSRFKWWYVVAAIIFLAIILPILFKVIIPALIKNIVDDQELPVRGGSLNAISPTKLEMELDTILDTPLAVKCDPLGLELRIPHGEYEDNGAFVVVDLPEKDINGETEIKFPSQEVNIIDEEQLTAWFNDFFDAATTELRVVVPELTAHLSSLKYTVELDSVIKVPGLNYLDGFSSIDQEIMIPPEDNGDNIKGHLNIPNSGTLTLGLANPSFFMVAGGVKLGLVTLPGLVLEPGNNTIFYHGQLFLDALVPNLSDILASQGTSFSEGYLDVNCTGNSTYTDDGEQIKYLEGVLNNKEIPLRIPLTQLLSALLGGVMGDEGLGDLGGDLGNLTDIGSLLDGLGGVIGNDTLFEGMLDHFENS